MLTRLKIKGFKNLLDAEIHLGPFTCLAGPNGVGKSNLFDAIQFLASLADRTLTEAAMTVRDRHARTTDISGLFYRSGHANIDLMSFEADMIVPSEGVDDLGQPASASRTYLTYKLDIRHRPPPDEGVSAGLEIEREELTYLLKREFDERIRFKKSKSWVDSVNLGRKTTPYISTQGGRIRLHQDLGMGGRPKEMEAGKLPRTVLSSVNASEAPTALLARQEMRSWRLLQLEPNSLRSPDEFHSPTSIGIDGSHLPATLNRLAHRKDEDPERVFSELSNRLSNLVDDIVDVRVSRDDKREIYSVEACGSDGIYHPARSLSDGTLRFMALAVIELDPTATGLLCMEEPENGIDPERVEAMVELLEDLALDPEEVVDETNPLRQVIINTHSPAVVSQVPEDSLVLLNRRRLPHGDGLLPGVGFACLPGTWRADTSEFESIPLGRILAILNPIRTASKSELPSLRRVVDRDDIRDQLELGFVAEDSDQWNK